MKRTLCFIMALLVALVFVPDGFAKTKWDLHLNYPAGNFHSKGAQTFADRVADATNGQVKIVLHPGSALGFKGPELLRAVAEGQLKAAEVPTGMVDRLTISFRRSPAPSPVDRSMTASAPASMAAWSLASSSSGSLQARLVPMLALTLTENGLPIPLGFRDLWVGLAGMADSPLAREAHTSSTLRPSSVATWRISSVIRPSSAAIL